MAIAPVIAKKKILLIEDEISMRHTIKASLRALGFENLIEANDGEQALVCFKKNNIDLAVCDWMMPKMSGIELFNTIKKDDKFKQIPFILLTGNDQKENVTEALKAGVKHYMVKPFSPMKLFEKVVELLEQQEKEKVA